MRGEESSHKEKKDKPSLRRTGIRNAVAILLKEFKRAIGVTTIRDQVNIKLRRKRQRRNNFNNSYPAGWFLVSQPR